MNATDRTPLDDPLMIALRDTLDAVDDAEAARPATAPAWDRVQRGMGRARRRRRQDRLVRAGAGLLAVTAAGAGVVTGVVPYPAFAPVVVVPGTGGKSELDDGRTRGSLADDETWLKAFREHVAAGDTWEEGGGESWRPPSAGKVSVLYAGDVGGYRLALVEGTWHWGPIGARQQVWFQGPAGAAASALEQGGNSGPSDVAVDVISAATTRDQIGSGSVVVVSAVPRKVVLEAPPVIDAAGKVTWDRETLTEEDGVYSAAVTASGYSTVTVEGLEYPEILSGSALDQPGPTVPSLVPARGGAAERRSPLVRFAGETWTATRQPDGPGHVFRLLAAEATERPQASGPVRAMVGMVTLPSGARVVSAGHYRSADNSVQLDSGRIWPGGADDSDLSIAWRQPATSTDPGWTAAMGPAGTVRLQWIHRDGTITSGAAEHTIASTEHDDVTSVRFLDADGGVLGAADVARSVDSMYSGVLPELAPAPVK